MKILRNLVAIALLAVLAGGLVGSPAAAGEQSEQTVFFDMFYEGRVKPNKIFTTANSGPYFKQIKWKNWGENRTTGRGRYISDCASCGKKENKPARLYMRKLIACPDVGVMTYRYVRLKIVDRRRPHRAYHWKFDCPPPGEGSLFQG